jgi:hypothetical protein
MLTYRIDADAQLVLVRGEGMITQRERLQTMLAWIRDPSYHTGLDTFCDFAATDSTPTLAELREVIATVREHALTIGPTRLAILTGKPITFGIAKVFGRLAEIDETPLQVRVFFDRAAAWTWLRPGAPPHGGSLSS